MTRWYHEANRERCLNDSGLLDEGPSRVSGSTNGLNPEPDPLSTGIVESLHSGDIWIPNWSTGDSIGVLGY